jgi:hypothetical protein
MKPIVRSPFTWILCLLFICQCQNVRAGTQPTRDHLTPQEADLVREAQLIDQRIAVFIHAAERRLIALGGPVAAAPKQSQKEMDRWGELPTGSRAELIEDMAQILDEAITNIDDVAAREDANQKMLRKALHTLSEAATRFEGQLEPMRAQAKEGPEREAIEQAIQNANSIIEAEGKLPPEPEEKKKKA